MKKDTYKQLPLVTITDEIKKHHSKKKLKCLIFGNFGAMNKGDDAILSGEITELKRIKNLSITVVARFPEEIKKAHGLKAVSFYSFFKVVQEIRKTDFVVVGGGGIISKVERGLKGFFYQLYMLSLFFLFPKYYKKRIYTWGIGVYSNASPLILPIAFSLLRFSSLITVRDAHSHDLLKRKNVHSILQQDNSFFMELLPQKSILQDQYIKRMYDRKRKHVGISLLKPDSKKEEKRLLHEIVAFIGKNKEQCDFWFYSLDNHPKYFNDEQFGHKLHETILKKVGKDVHFYLIPTEWDAQKTFSSFQLMDHIITMRFHGAVFAYRTGVPFTGISYDKKCASFIKSIGQEPVEVSAVSWKYLQKQLGETK